MCTRLRRSVRGMFVLLLLTEHSDGEDHMVLSLSGYYADYLLLVWTISSSSQSR
jgi:hypothetical protein